MSPRRSFFMQPMHMFEILRTSNKKTVSQTKKIKDIREALPTGMNLSTKNEELSGLGRSTYKTNAKKQNRVIYSK